jgi:hypothetical protein
MNTEKIPLEEKSCFDNVLEWMQSKFDGDVDKLTSEAMKHVKKQKYALGPLWNEIGERALRIFFMERLRLKRNFGADSNIIVNTHISPVSVPSIEQKDGEGDARGRIDNQMIFANPSPNSVYLEWYPNPREQNSWINLGDMTKEDCLLLSHDYKERARANQGKGIFFAELAAKLNSIQKVKDAVSEDEIKQIWTSVKKS